MQLDFSATQNGTFTLIPETLPRICCLADSLAGAAGNWRIVSLHHRFLHAQVPRKQWQDVLVYHVCLYLLVLGIQMGR